LFKIGKKNIIVAKTNREYLFHKKCPSTIDVLKDNSKNNLVVYKYFI
jgi:hypothetical protein